VGNTKDAPLSGENMGKGGFSTPSPGGGGGYFPFPVT